MTMYINLPQKILLACLALPVLFTPLARADYQSTVLSNNPKAFYRLNDSTARSNIHTNLGSLGAAGNATNDLMSYKQSGVFGFDPTGIVHPFSGAIAGDGNRSAFFDYTTRATIPFNSAINTPATQPFTVEAWFYPSTDQNSVGMSPINNRYTVGANRQGWTYFQRKVNADSIGGDPVGWNFRMYNGVGGASPLDTTAVVPFDVGKWVHVVTVYSPASATDATVTMYINGVPAVTNRVFGQPVYQPCTGDHDTVTESPAGQPGMSIGCYNNCNTSLNPWFGGVDEFAWYGSALSAAQILAHYQNGTNANRATPYDTLIKSHNPVVYLRLDEIAPDADKAVNLGDTRSAGLATHTAEVNHPVKSALKGRSDDGAASYHLRNGNATTTMPFLADNNPSANVPFTFSCWLRPMNDRQNPGAAAANNRFVGTANRTGWVIFQRAPNSTYTNLAGYSGVGWNFRMYSGSSGTGQDVTTDVPYTVGEWQHLVVTWVPQLDVGPALNGGTAWQGTLTAFFNGVPVASNTAAVYAANTDPNENASTPVDFAVGSYNAASGLGNNPFEGDVDEVAIYNNYVMTADQVLSHYQAGTNAPAGTNYETLVMTAAFVGPQPQRSSLPKTYLRFNDPAYFPAANSGSLAASADGNQVTATNTATGPRPPAYPGFETSNTATALNGTKQWISLNNPAGLNFTGQITVEAWVKPDATQADGARIVAHGAPTYSVYLAGPPPTDYGAPTNGNEVFLKVEGASPPYNYTFGTSTFTNGLGTSYNYVTAVGSASDFGSGNWVHLVGTYDGATWRLYRNGAQIGITAGPAGALAVNNADWAIGSTGNGWANNFAGAVDEVAIYNTALTPAQVATHYSAACPLNITRSGGNVTLTWCSGTLQASGIVTGTYTNVTGALPPSYTTPASNRLFFRVKY